MLVQHVLGPVFRTKQNEITFLMGIIVNTNIDLNSTGTVPYIYLVFLSWSTTLEAFSVSACIEGIH